MQLMLATLASAVLTVHAASPAVLFKPAASVDLASGGVGNRIAVGDFDQDGNRDLVTTPDLFAPESFPNVDGVTLLFGDGQGGFPQVNGFLAGEYLTDIDTADFNGDGIPDLVTTEGFDGSVQSVPVGLCASAGPRVPVFLGSAIGTFTQQLPCLYAGQRPGAAATGDFDEDGLFDLVVTLSSADVSTLARDTYFLSGNGNGSFAAGQVFVTEKSNHVSVADFNRDGHLDLAMPGSIYLGSGRGTFVAGPVAAGGEAVGDINNDGIADLASLGTNSLYNAADDVVRVHLGQADGSLIAFGTPLPTGTDPNVESHPVAVGIADMNGDGYGDIVVVNGETDDVAIYLRDPLGTFHSRQNVSTAVLTAHGWVSSSPRGLAIADWNRDGHLDIVVSNYNPSSDGTPYDGTVTVLIQDAVARPAASDDTAVTPEETAVLVDVSANDYDAAGTLDANSITVVRQPTHGSAVNAGGGKFSYTPAAGFAGVDDFSYTISNTGGTVSNIATATLIVKRNNKLPVARDDAAATLSNASVTIDVLANDNDPDGSLLPGTVVLLSQPTSGSASVDSLSGAVVYQPGAAGSYSFTYSVQDNGGASTNAATVNVSVTAANTPPLANNDSATTASGTSVVIYVLANDSDPDGDILDKTKIAIATPPAHGGVTVNKTTGGVSYTPVSGYSGPDSFDYTVKDIRGATSNAATVTITVTAVNLAPVASNIALNVSEDVSGSGILSATDPEGAGLSFSIVSNGTKGTATITNVATGAYTYQPSANATGTDSFTFRASDGTLNSNTGTVTVTISAVNDAPLAANDSAMAVRVLRTVRRLFGSTTRLYRILPVTVNVLANDSDVDGTLNPATVTLVTSPASGTATVNATTGSITYVPTATTYGTVSFTYAVRDNAGALSNPATVTIKVTSVIRKGGL